MLKMLRNYRGFYIPEMKIPPSIKPGDKIRIVSPAGKVSEEHVFPAVEWLQKQGYNVELGKHVFASHFQFAGTDNQRLDDLQTALNDTETAAIICSRGGYGTVRIIRQIDLTKFIENPKWLVGFSDISILHSCINSRRVATIHGVMPKYFFEDDGAPTENLKSLMLLLTGGKTVYSFKNSEKNRPGIVTAELVGGNLSIISSMQGTPCELKTDGKILFLEDIDEFLYHTDRMIHQLKLSGKLDKLAGLVLGDFSEMKDNESPFGRTVHEIIIDAVQEFDYPVCFGFPAGHDKKNLALAFGLNWELEVLEQCATLGIRN
jgi:muramoyltetrapeptide carboxypeptidase